MIVNGFLDWAERIDGHPRKVYSQPNTGEGIACHSVVGDLPNHQVPARFLSEALNPDGSFTPAAAASVMFILYRDGHLVQMYPTSASTWTSGGFDGNTRYWAIEAEGGGPADYTEKLTKEAEDTFIRIVDEWETHTGHVAVPGVNVLQHKDIARKYGYAATACASDRYSNAWARVTAGERYDEGMTPEERTKFDAMYAALTGGVPGVLEKWNTYPPDHPDYPNQSTGNSLLIGYTDHTASPVAHGHKHSAKGQGPRPV